MTNASTRETSAARGSPACTVGLDLRRRSRVAAVAVDRRGRLRAWASIQGEDDPVALAKLALEALSVTARELRVLVGSEWAQAGTWEGVREPDASQIAELLAAEGHAPIMAPAVASAAAGSGSWLVAACDEEKARSLAEGLAELVALEPTLVVDQLLLLQQLQAGGVAMEGRGDELLIVARPADSAALARSLTGELDAEQARSEALRTLQAVGGARQVWLLGSRRAELRQLLEHGGLELRQEAMPVCDGQTLPPGLELTWRLATARDLAVLAGPRLAKRRRIMLWARRASILAVALVCLSAGLALFGAVASLRMRARHMADGEGLAAIQTQAQRLREAGDLAREVSRLRSELGPRRVPWPRLAAPIADLARQSPQGIGWERLTIDEGQLELEASAASASDLELLRSGLERGFGISNASWDEPTPSEDGPGLRQTFRATLVTPQNVGREAP